MIVDLLLAIGRLIDRLFGHERPARSSLAAWRIPLQLPHGDGPWSFDPTLIDDVDLATVSIDSKGWLTAEQAHELAIEDVLRLTGDDLG